jgi:hypothetical protein
MQVIEETQVDFDETKRDFSSEIHTLEREIYDQTEKTEFLQQIVGELKKELDDLKWCAEKRLGFWIEIFSSFCNFSLRFLFCFLF